MSKSSALGRGLESLIPQTKTITEEVIPSAQQELLNISLESIQENPRQPRKDFVPEDLADLVISIKEHGILQPIVVTKLGQGFELIAGERRLRASRELELETIPAIVREASEQEKLELALIENVQRAQLNAIEEAFAYKALIEEFGLSQEKVAERVGKSRSTIANDLRLLELPDEMCIALRSGKISKGHARMLLSEADFRRREKLFQEMLAGGMSVREAESRVLGIGKRSSVKDPNIAALEKTLREALGTKIDIKERGGKGNIKISFYSREELLDLIDQFSSI